jgi:hypothetical protein
MIMNHLLNPQHEFTPALMPPGPEQTLSPPALVIQRETHNARQKWKYSLSRKRNVTNGEK